MKIKPEIKTFLSKDNFMIGTLITDKDNCGFLRYNNCFTSNPVNIFESEVDEKNLQEIVERVERYCTNHSIFLTIF
jgi:hypothetical protein